MHRNIVVVLAVPLLGCLRFLPEASVRADGPLDEVLAPVETASGLRFVDPPDRVITSTNVPPVALLRESSLRAVCAGGSGALSEALSSSFALPERRSPLAAAEAAPWPGARSRYDTSGVVVLPGSAAVDAATVGAAAGDLRAARRADLDSLRSFAEALHHQHLKFDAEKVLGDPLRLDRNEALLAVIAGGAWLATLEASLAPVNVFDASAAPIRRRIESLAEALLEDPEAAAAEALADPHLPEAMALALHEVLELSGAARERYVLRVFGGARLLVRAKDRVAGGGVAAVLADPPTSSEQLLHPERYLDRDDPPVTVTRGGRGGLLGSGLRVVETGVAGEHGLLRALQAALPFEEAAAAAEGWGGDLLTVYRPDDGGEPALAWRLVFDSRGEARQAASAFRRALALVHGGAWTSLLDDDWALDGGAHPAHLRRVDRSLAVVLGGDPSRHGGAVEALLAEECKHVESTAQGASQDRVFRALRAVASPIFHDAPGRFDRRMSSLYGLLFRHRTWPAAGELEALNPNGVPLLGALLPDEARGLLFTGERGSDRRDTSFLLGSIRAYGDEARGAGRFWSPLVSWSSGPEYRSFAVLLGALWEQEDGEGRRERSPRLLFSRESGLDGAERSFGVLLDLVQHRVRAGRDRRVAVGPEGLFAQWTGFDDPGGFEVGLLGEAIRVRRRTVLPDASHLDLSLLWGVGMRCMSDDAADRGEWSALRGLAFGLYSTSRRSEFGVGRLFGRSLLGFGAQDGRGFMDLMYLRVGG